MNLTNQILAEKEQFLQMLETYPQNEPVTMINILKFKEKTGRGGETGKEAYAAYGRKVEPLLKKVGAELIWAGDIVHTIIGDYTDQPHRVLLVRYPNIQAFMNMATSEEYQPISEDREVALEYGGLLAAKELSGLG